MTMIIIGVLIFGIGCLLKRYVDKKVEYDEIQGFWTESSLYMIVFAIMGLGLGFIFAKLFNYLITIGL